MDGKIAPIASSVGRSEAPKALSEFHRSLPQGNPLAVSDILDNLEKAFPAYRGFPKMDTGLEFYRSKYTIFNNNTKNLPFGRFKLFSATVIA